jgi:nucleotide-binding universal stress UspA family protein
MFGHILIPTDGSTLAAKGVKTGVKLAKALGARVTGVYVIPPYVPRVYDEGVSYGPILSPQQYKENAEKEAKKVLAVVERAAETAGVRCATQVVTDPQPWGGILRAASSRKCGLIAMASHGRGALGGLLLGSQTQRVLAHSKIPVLVIR